MPSKRRTGPPGRVTGRMRAEERGTTDTQNSPVAVWLYNIEPVSMSKARRARHFGRPPGVFAGRGPKLTNFRSDWAGQPGIAMVSRENEFSAVFAELHAAFAGHPRRGCHRRRSCGSGIDRHRVDAVSLGASQIFDSRFCRCAGLPGNVQRRFPRKMAMATIFEIRSIGRGET